MNQDEFDEAVHDLLKRYRDVRDDPGGAAAGILSPRETWLYERLRGLGPGPAAVRVEAEIGGAAGLAPETASALGLTALVLAVAQAMKAMGLTREQAVGRIGAALDVAWEGAADP